MDWESKFSSIVRETESNLAKVKNRLGSSRISTNAEYAWNGASPGIRDSVRRSSVSSQVAHRNNRALDADIADRFGSLNVVGEPNGFSLEQSPGVLTLLSDKLDAQTQVIHNLVRTVSRLEEEKDLSHKQIKNLKDELSNVEARMAEKGIDLQTEHKIERWRRDVASEIHHLQTQLKYHRSSDEDAANVSQVSSFIREMHDLKRYFQDEMNSVRRDVESLKSRIVRVETDMLSISVENRDVGRRHDRLEQNLRDIGERQQWMNPVDLEKRTTDHSPGRYEVAELKSSLKLLENKLANVESKVQPSKNEMQTYLKPKNKHKSVTNTSDLLSPYSSDVDLSDFSTDDLDEDLKPSKLKTRSPKADTEFDLDDDYDDYGLTTDDLLSTGVDTEDL